MMNLQINLKIFLVSYFTKKLRFKPTSMLEKIIQLYNVKLHE